jgi:glycosyltransferase involved in cell wall biosynthesis
MVRADPTQRAAHASRLPVIPGPLLLPSPAGAGNGPSGVPDYTPSQRLQIVYLALTDWEGSRQRPQHLALELSRAHRVLYVRPVPLTRWLRDRGRIPLRPTVERVNQSLELVRPRLLSPGRIGRVARWNGRMVASYVRRLLDPTLPTVLWLSHPNQASQIGSYGEQLTCFDWMDYHAAFKDGAEREIIETAELGLLRGADLFFASSQDLVRRARQLSVEAVRVPNAADPEYFAMAATTTLPCPPEIEALPRPRLLFYGTFGPWVDTTFLRALALTRPDWPLVLVGAITDDTSDALRDLPNVHWLGWRPYEELPPYLQHADVCLLPFRTGSLTRAVDPVKLYEYLAAGKPVIATPLDEFAKCGDLVDVVTCAEQAASVIEEHLQAPEPAERRLKRMAFARENTWKHRAATVLEALDQRFEVRGGAPAKSGGLVQLSNGTH